MFTVGGFVPVHAATYEYGVDEINTVGGKVQISHIDKDYPERGRKLALGGKLIAKSKNALSIRATYPEEPRTKFILLESNTGGVGCPFFFRVLEIKDDKKVTLTDEFGNCDDLANPSFYKVKENPSFEEGVWHIALATALPEHVKEKLRAQTQVTRSGGNIEVKRPKGLPEDLKGEVKWYQYKNGKITQGGKPVATTDDPEWEWREKLEHAIPDSNERNALIKKYGSVSEAYCTWLTDEANRKVRPEEFR